MYNNRSYTPQRQSYYNSGRTYGGGYQKKQVRKRSGAKIKMIEGSPFISAWRKNRSGFYTLYARPCKNTKERKSENGKVWLNLFVTITNQTSMQTNNCSALYDVERRRLYLKDFNQIVTTNGSGGYWGVHISNKR